MRRYGMLVVLAALALGLVASDLLAQPQGGGDRGRGAPGGATRVSRFGGGMMGGGSVFMPDHTARIEGLSAQQREQITAIRKVTTDKIAELQKQMNAEIKQRVLTPAQATQMEEAERAATHRGPDGVTMTDAQKKVMDEARAEAGKIEDREARTAIMQEAMEKIRASYTDEQKKAAADARSRFQRGGPGGGNRPGGNRPAGGGN